MGARMGTLPITDEWHEGAAVHMPTLGQVCVVLESPHVSSSICVIVVFCKPEHITVFLFVRLRGVLYGLHDMRYEA